MYEKLASVEKITEIKDIQGADFISAGKVLGYWTVIKKGGFSVGDLIVFHNPDCIADVANPVYSFLKGDGRLRVRKFKKQVSWGLVLPLSNFADKFDINSVVEGQDVSKEINIVKYVKEIPACLSGQVEGDFPSFMHKTGTSRLQNYLGVLEEFKGKFSSISLKRDGTSFTAYLKDEKFGVCSRNLELRENGGDIYWKIAREYKIEEALRGLRAKYPGDYSCAGEIFGVGINGNTMKSDKVQLELFDIFSISHQKYATVDVFMEICVGFNLPFVPVIWADKFDFTLERLVEMANTAEYGAGLPAEGIIVKLAGEEYSNVLGGRSNFKVISETYCLEHKE